MARKYGVYSPEFKTQAISLVKEGKRPTFNIQDPPYCTVAITGIGRVNV